jgi:hypothetical protein
MRYREAAVAGEFANWTPMFEPATAWRGHIPQVKCTKCLQYVDTDKIEGHLTEQHKFDLEDGIVIQVNNQWWRRRGVKA